jgi:hypothetical protein
VAASLTFCRPTARSAPPPFVFAIFIILIIITMSNGLLRIAVLSH